MSVYSLLLLLLLPCLDARRARHQHRGLQHQHQHRGLVARKGFGSQLGRMQRLLKDEASAELGSYGDTASHDVADVMMDLEKVTDIEEDTQSLSEVVNGEKVNDVEEEVEEGSGAEAEDDDSGNDIASDFPEQPKRSNWFERCGDCQGEPEAEVCGSDGKTYSSSCDLEYWACRKYWDITEVSKGPCETPCPGVTLGMFSGWGSFRASNKGLCHHDFFRCLKISRTEGGMEAGPAKTCCQQRFDQCANFVAEKPWKAGILRFGGK